ncbi:phosphatase PAP2 family protein [Sphingomonas sp. UYEF23]|uniref:phosphatase PAP2 family protein n=1 Tax=Sphingomonas sp. UYEF23 TaxID=1756408 RepID=UPI003399D361
MHSLDASATQSINGLSGHSATLDYLLIHVSAWGVPALVLAVAAQWWLPGDRSRNRHILIASGLSFGLALALNQVILLFVHRIRPYDAGLTRLLIERSGDPSFPSDHATATVAIAGAFFLHHAPIRGLIFAIAAGIVCFSRVYIGTHYVGDVLGGAVTGTLGAIVAMILYRPKTRLDRVLTGIF